MAKRALVSQYTPVRSPRPKTSLVHALEQTATEKAVCGFRAKKGWIVIPAVQGVSEWKMLTCPRCKAGCK